MWHCSEKNLMEWHVFFMIWMSRTTFPCGGEYVTCRVMSVVDKVNVCPPDSISWRFRIISSAAPRQRHFSFSVVHDECSFAPDMSCWQDMPAEVMSSGHRWLQVSFCILYDIWFYMYGTIVGYMLLYSLVLFWMNNLRLKLGKFRLMETKDCQRMPSLYGV